MDEELAALGVQAIEHSDLQNQIAKEWENVEKSRKQTRMSKDLLAVEEDIRLVNERLKELDEMLVLAPSDLNKVTSLKARQKIQAMQTERENKLKHLKKCEAKRRKLHLLMNDVPEDRNSIRSDRLMIPESSGFRMGAHDQHVIPGPSHFMQKPSNLVPGQCWYMRLPQHMRLPNQTTSSSIPEDELLGEGALDMLGEQMPIDTPTNNIFITEDTEFDKFLLGEETARTSRKKETKSFKPSSASSSKVRPAFPIITDPPKFFDTFSKDKHGNLCHDTDYKTITESLPKTSKVTKGSNRLSKNEKGLKRKKESSINELSRNDTDDSDDNEEEEIEYSDDDVYIMESEYSSDESEDDYEDKKSKRKRVSKYAKEKNSKRLRNEPKIRQARRMKDDGDLKYYKRRMK